MAKKLTFLDKTFWITESKASPKHVAGLQILSKPDDAGKDYIANLVDKMREFNKAYSPFNLIIKSFLGYPTGTKTTTKLDMKYHVQHHKINSVEDRVELHQFVAKLHEPMLDRDKPLWKVHIIEGKDGKQFATLFMVHHMYGDGASLVRWFQQGYSDAPEDTFTPVWALQRKKKKRHKDKSIGRYFKSFWHAIVTIKDLAVINWRLLMKLLRIYPVYMPVPFTGKKTVLTGQVAPGRVVATTDIDFERIQKLSKRLRASVNEILLCSFDIGVHRFLRDYGHTFDKAIITQMPINLRRPGEQVGGNQIAIVPVQLAYGKKDPYLRLRQIVENHRIVKSVAKRTDPLAFSWYTILIQSWSLVFEMLKISDWFRPIGNILISNVPGPKQQKYLGRCKLEAVYPISTLAPGGGVNITLLTYADKANIGLVTTDRKIKNLEPMAAYFNDAFDLLEKCVDDHTVSIDDLAEHRTATQKAVIEEFQHYSSWDVHP